MNVYIDLFEAAIGTTEYGAVSSFDGTRADFVVEVLVAIVLSSRLKGGGPARRIVAPELTSQSRWCVGLNREYDSVEQKSRSASGFVAKKVLLVAP